MTFDLPRNHFSALTETETEVLTITQTEVDLESQVVIHGSITADFYADRVRIWPTTYLVDRHSQHKSQLIWHEGISMYPTWTFLRSGKNYFTLIFSGLPKSCVIFDLVEEIPQPGGFLIEGILRNQSDVYNVSFD